MRIIAAAILAVGTAFAALPAWAQTYAPGYPVCLHVYGEATYYDCRYNSIAQCNLAAAGRGAQCVPSPYAANAGMDGPPVGYHHYRRGY